MQTQKTTKLNETQREYYWERGYLFPIRVFDDAEAASFRSQFDKYVAESRGQLEGVIPRERRAIFGQTHLFLHWVYQMVSHPRVLDAVESVLGPDILVWESAWFIKFAKDKAYVSWHQDGTYWSLHPLNVTTAWIALSESNVANGCLRVIPGTHKSSFMEQRETYARDNILSRGQEIAMQVDEARAVDLVLRPGEMSLHHVAIVHGSKSSVSDVPRIGLAVRYISPDVAQDGPERQIAQLVRGLDRYGHFEIVGPPREGVVDRDLQAEALRRVLRNVMPRDSERGKDT